MDVAGNITYVTSGIYEKLAVSGGPSVNLNVFPVPTGVWVNQPIDAYVMESGDSELLGKAKKFYEITNSSLYPDTLSKIIPSDKKITLNLVGENFIHLQYILDDGTKISSTSGPYLIDTSSTGDFEMKLTGANGNPVTEWTNQTLNFVITNPSTSSISGVKKEYRIEGIHHDWQPYKEGMKINLEGQYRIFGRVVSGTGVSTEQKLVTSKIDKTAPELVSLKLLKNATGQYDVSAKAVDDLSGVKEATLNDGTKLVSKTSGYELEGIATKPTEINLIDKAGNSVTSISFATEPSITYEAPYSPDLDSYRGDVTIHLTGATNYIIGNKTYTCTTDPCSITISNNTTLTVIYTDGSKETKQTIKIGNIDRAKAQLVLNGKRNLVNPLQIEFSWKPALTNGTLNCVENGTTVGYDVSNKSFVLNGKNYAYKCLLTGEYNGETLKSNTIIIYSSGAMPVDGSGNQGGNGVTTSEVNTNVYIIETKAGKSYIINAKSDNYKYDHFPLPENDVTRD